MAIDEKQIAFREIFDKQWQRQFIGVLCRSKVLAGQALSELNHRYFEHPHDRVIVKLILNYLEEYHNLPTLADLKTAVRISVKEGDIEKEELSEISKLVDWCYQIEIPESTIQSSISNFIHFARQQAMKLAIIESSELVQQQPIQECEDEIRARFDSVNAIGKSKQDLGINLYDLPSILLATSVDKLIPSFETQIYPQIDQAMGGGFSRGAIYSIMADAGIGKTTLLINLSSALLWRGCNVAHITLELSEAKTAMRYGSRLLRTVDWKDIHKSASELDERLSHVKLMGGGQLFIKEFATRSLSLSGLRGHMMLMETQGADIDILTIDYADLMRLRGQDKRHEELETLYEKLRGLGQELNCVVLTASQSNRIGASKFRPTSGNITGSYGKVAAVDGLLGVCRTPAERAAGLTRCYILKSRESAWSKTVWLKTDLQKCWMVEMTTADVPAQFLEQERRGGREENNENN